GAWNRRRVARHPRRCVGSTEGHGLGRPGRVTLHVPHGSYTDAAETKTCASCRGESMTRCMLVAIVVLHVCTSARLHAQSFQQRLLAVPDTASMRQTSRDLSPVPHMAGRPARAATRNSSPRHVRSRS